MIPSRRESTAADLKMHRVAHVQRKLEGKLFGVAEDFLIQTDLQEALVVSIYPLASLRTLTVGSLARTFRATANMISARTNIDDAGRAFLRRFRTSAARGSRMS